jgi:hypothetical protein
MVWIKGHHVIYHGPEVPYPHGRVHSPQCRLNPDVGTMLARGIAGILYITITTEDILDLVYK